MFLKIKSGPRNNRPNITPTGKVHFSNLSNCGVRFFRFGSPHTKTNPRSLGVSPHFRASVVNPRGRRPSSPNQLIKRGHVEKGFVTFPGKPPPETKNKKQMKKQSTGTPTGILPLGGLNPLQVSHLLGQTAKKNVSASEGNPPKLQPPRSPTGSNHLVRLVNP